MIVWDVYVIGDMESGGPICAAFPDLSTPSPEIFAALSQSIRLKQSVEITYRSMGETAPHKRTISPHHVVRAGRRWHVRAFSSKHQNFRDYALGRIVAVTLLNSPQERAESQDAAWNTIVPVRLITHRNLSREQEEVIRFEYFTTLLRVSFHVAARCLATLFRIHVRQQIPSNNYRQNTNWQSRIWMRYQNGCFHKNGLTQ